MTTRHTGPNQPWPPELAVAGTLASLAEQIGFDADALAAANEAFNRDAEEGREESRDLTFRRFRASTG